MEDRSDMNVLKKILLFPLLFVSVSAQARVLSGDILNWCESDQLLNFDVVSGYGVNSQIIAWWSVASVTDGTSYFYGGELNDLPNVEVAIATGVKDVSEIADAAIYDFDRGSIGPLEGGTVVLYRNLKTGYYAAIKIDNVRPTEDRVRCSYKAAVLNGTWYLQDDKTPDFGALSSQ